MRVTKDREIMKITPSLKHDNKVILEFTDGSATLRNFYVAKKKHLKYIIFDYRYYKILRRANYYDFILIDDKERKRYGLEEKPVKEKPVVPKVVKEEPKIDISKLGYDPNAKHYNFEVIKSLLRKGIPVYLFGPAGSGKNYTIKKIAKELKLDFYFENSVQDAFKITGFIDANGKYQETEFYRAWTKGGLFFLDELDGSIPDVLITLNAAIANGYYTFPCGRLDAHPDFRVIAAGNTAGNGADEMYTGRSVIDISTCDRFAFVPFEYDKNIELQIAKGNKELVNFIRECRKIAKNGGMRVVFTYRALEMITIMESDEENTIDLKTLLQMCVFKGMTHDDINLFQTWEDNRYTRALREIQNA